MTENWPVSPVAAIRRAVGSPARNSVIVVAVAITWTSTVNADMTATRTPGVGTRSWLRLTLTEMPLVEYCTSN